MVSSIEILLQFSDEVKKSASRNNAVTYFMKSEFVTSMKVRIYEQISEERQFYFIFGRSLVQISV